MSHRRRFWPTFPSLVNFRRFRRAGHLHNASRALTAGDTDAVTARISAAQHQHVTTAAGKSFRRRSPREPKAPRPVPPFSPDKTRPESESKYQRRPHRADPPRPHRGDPDCAESTGRLQWFDATVDLLNPPRTLRRKRRVRCRRCTTLFVLPSCELFSRSVCICRLPFIRWLSGFRFSLTQKLYPAFKPLITKAVCRCLTEVFFRQISTISRVFAFLRDSHFHKALPIP